MNSKALQNVNEEKDLGVIIDNQLKFHRHVSLVSSKVHQLLALIRQSFYLFRYRNFSTFIQIYSAANPGIW